MATGATMNALCTAASKGEMENVVKALELVDKGEIDITSAEGVVPRTALHAASAFGYTEIVKLLMDRPDVDINQPTTTQETPLRLATFNGHIDVVKLLLARPDVDVNKADNLGFSPLHNTAAEDFAHIAKLFLKRQDININATTRYGDTPLSLGLFNGTDAVIRLLLRRDDVDVNHLTEEEQTPMIVAVKERPQNSRAMLLLTRYMAAPIMTLFEGTRRKQRGSRGRRGVWVRRNK